MLRRVVMGGRERDEGVGKEDWRWRDRSGDGGIGVEMEG